MAVHQPELHARPYGGVDIPLRRGRGPTHAHRRAVRPQPHRHVVARADEHVGSVWAPGEPAHGVLVPAHHGQGPIVRHAQIKGPDDAIDARRGDDARRSVRTTGILVPVVCENLGGLWGRQGQGLLLLLLLLMVRGGAGGEEAVAARRGLVYGDVGDEVVLG